MRVGALALHFSAAAGGAAGVGLRLGVGLSLPLAARRAPEQGEDWAAGFAARTPPCSPDAARHLDPRA